MAAKRHKKREGAEVGTAKDANSAKGVNHEEHEGHEEERARCSRR